MAQRALNKVQLIGNLTRDPELRYTPQGTAVCTFGLATNRSWSTETGDKKEEAEFHRLVAWNKLAEICSQLLFKGRRIYVEGRLQTRQWTGKDGVPRQTTEIVVADMIILDSKRSPDEIEEPIPEEPGSMAGSVPEEEEETPLAEGTVETGKKSPRAKSAAPKATDKTNKTKKKSDDQTDQAGEESQANNDQEVKPEDIPF